MDYICYISRSKVDGLYGQICPDALGEVTEQVVTEQARTGELQTGLSLWNVISLFKGGITYGRKSVIQRERKVKAAYVEKLREVLINIAADHGDVPDIEEVVTSGRQDSVYCFHRGSFRVETPVSDPQVGDIVTLQCPVGDRTLYLDCSLRYFSEGPEPDGSFLLHSGNHRFFTANMSLTLQGVFVLLQVEGEKIFGTPLYLQLSAASGIAL